MKEGRGFREVYFEEVTTPQVIPFILIALGPIVHFTCLKVLNRSDFDASPSILSATTVLAKDLELPGLPTTNSGILSSMHTTIMNTFSLKAVLRAMFWPNSSSSKTAFWHLQRNKVKVNPHASLGSYRLRSERGTCKKIHCRRSGYIFLPMQQESKRSIQNNSQTLKISCWLPSSSKAFNIKIFLKT